MRRLMWFTVGFTAICLVGIYFLLGDWLWAVFGVCLAAFVILCKLGNYRNLRVCKITAAVLLGISVGAAWVLGYDGLYLKTPREYDGETVKAQIQIRDYSFAASYGVAADGSVELNGKTYAVRGYFGNIDPLLPGDVVDGTFRFRMTTADSAEGATYHRGNGIFLLAYVTEQPVVTRSEEIPNRYAVAVFREKLTGLLEQIFPGDTRGFAKALLLGDSSELTYAEDTDFKVSGIRHIVAVSGLHVSIVFSLVYLFGGRNRFWALLLGMPVLTLFCALAGFTPSIVRACIMQALMILANLLHKEYDAPTALAFSVLVMLGINPMSVTSVSLQLSVGCMMGIFLFCVPISEYLLRVLRCPKGNGIRAKLTRWLCGGIAVTLSAMAVTTPLSALYFGTVSVVSIFTNLLTLWCVNGVFYGIMLACAVGSVWTAGGMAVAWLVSWAIRFIKLVAAAMSSLPYSAVYTCSIYIIAWLIFAYLLLILFLVHREKHPAMLAVCIVLGLVISIAASWIAPKFDKYRLTVMDVGQGQSVLWSCGGKNYLVDCGGDSPESAADTTAQMLLSQGITRLDGVILTHYDKDHAGGVEYLLYRISTDALYLPQVEDDGGYRQRLQELFADRTVPVTKQLKLLASESSLTLIPGEECANENESGLCVLFQTENCDILITGDRGASGERELMDQFQLPKLEVLVVGHHGSSSATCFEFLSRTQPRIAVISVSADNSFGHPASAVLERLELFGCRILRTDRDGTIIIKG